MKKNTRDYPKPRQNFYTGGAAAQSMLALNPTTTTLKCTGSERDPYACDHPNSMGASNTANAAAQARYDGGKS